MKAVVLGLEGERPDLIDPALAAERFETVSSTAKLTLAGDYPMAPAGRCPAGAGGGAAEEGWIVGRGARGEPQFGAWPTLTQPPVVAELGDWSARFGFVATGLGITTVPRLSAAAPPEGIVCVEIDDPGWTGRSMGLARIGDLTGSAAVVRSALIAEARLIAQYLPES